MSPHTSKKAQLQNKMKAHVTVECAREGRMLDEVIQTFLEERFPMNAAAPENRPTGDPVAEVPSRTGVVRLGHLRAKRGSDET